MVYTHDEYLDFRRNEEKVSWLTRLKTSCKIYEGDIKGFSDHIDDKEKWKRRVRRTITRLLVDTLSKPHERLSDEDYL